MSVTSFRSKTLMPWPSSRLRVFRAGDGAGDAVLHRRQFFDEEAAVEPVPTPTD
jgi:hypothetical protein